MAAVAEGMAQPVVLIITATSRNGREAAKQLLARGKCAVRLGVRDPAKVADLVAEGAEAVPVDTSKLESMKEATRGVDFVYLVLPSLVQGAEVIMFDNFVQAARATGVKHVVFMSSMDADPSTGFTSFQDNRGREQTLISSGIPTTVLRPTWFHENALFFADPIKHMGEFRSSGADGVWTSVAVCDIAAAAVEVLSNPSPHTNKVYALTTEALTDKQLAEKISKVAGKSVAHVNMSPEEHYDFLKKIYQGPESGADEFAYALVNLDEGKRRGLFSKVHPDLEQLIGRKGITLDDFLAENAGAFKTQEAA